MEIARDDDAMPGEILYERTGSELSSAAPASRPQGDDNLGMGSLMTLCSLQKTNKGSNSTNMILSEVPTDLSYIPGSIFRNTDDVTESQWGRRSVGR